MTTENKDFKVKNGLVVQGSSATVNGYQVLTRASSINDLDDVSTIGVVAGQTLVYDSTLGSWFPGAASGGGGDSFKTISVAGQDNVVADSSTDTLTFVASTNVTITTNAGTDSITFAATDTNTTYSVSAESTTGGANLRLTGSDSTTDDIKIEGSGLATVTRVDANTINVDANIDISFNPQTTSYTLVLADKNKMVEINSSSATTLTVPLNSAEAFSNGSQISILQTGTGQVTVAGASGVTVDGTPGLKLRAQWSTATLIKRSTNSWLLVGDLVL